jgi:hypothetical protein
VEPVWLQEQIWGFTPRLMGLRDPGVSSLAAASSPLTYLHNLMSIYNGSDRCPYRFKLPPPQHDEVIYTTKLIIRQTNRNNMFFACNCLCVHQTNESPPDGELAFDFEKMELWKIYTRLRRVAQSIKH